MTHQPKGNDTPLTPKTRESVIKEIAKIKKHLSEVEALMRPPITPKQEVELRNLQLNDLSLIAEYEDWLAQGVPILPPGLLMRRGN